ncbi:MAG: tRNA lysidine(34) synthetase TilS [Deltaproteobacteria bacterium]|nr:tRNA lysidine(34) synthetase TilS [Deltaproteobacteria bacterium]MBW2068168.1 tRNA lysidine(34) synthetase TilS [Deltaproteobacteria bacterium]
MHQTSKTGLHPLEEKVFLECKNHDLILPGDFVIVAVSGGPDSIALLYSLYNLRSLLNISKLAVAHFNHKIRPEAEEEEKFVQFTAGKLALPFYREEADVKRVSTDEGLSLEMAARRCRYDFLLGLKEKLGANRVALGHTASDKAEEVLLRIIRGTGIRGLSSISRKGDNGVIIRPLLSIYRKEILTYLNELGISFKLDNSNESPAFQRNRVRHEVLPLLNDISGRDVVSLLNRLADVAEDEEQVWRSLISKWWRKVCLKNGGEGEIVWDRKIFASVPVAVQRRLIFKAVEELAGSSYGFFFERVEAVRDLILNSQSGRFIRWRNLEVLVDGGNAVFKLAKHNGDSSEFCYLLPEPGEYWLDELGAFISISEVTKYATFPKNPFEELIDADSLTWPLRIRPWQKGDRFIPLGMRKFKKIQDFFVDEKVPLRLRRKVPILVDRDKVCWIIGYRLDDRLKVKPSSRKVFKLSLSFRRSPC